MTKNSNKDRPKICDERKNNRIHPSTRSAENQHKLWRNPQATWSNNNGNYLKDVETDVAVDVDVGMEAGVVELHFWRLEGVVVGEGEGELVHHSFVHGFLAP